MKSIFQYVKRLTEQTEIGGLNSELNEIIVENFPGVQVSVYKLQEFRLADSKTSCPICIDCLGNQQTFSLNNGREMEFSFQSKEVTISTIDKQRTKIIIPVVLCDKSVSHVNKRVALILWEGSRRDFRRYAANL